MKRLTKILMGGIILSLCGVALPAWSMNVGYVDMELALSSTKAGKRAKGDIDKEVSKRRKVLDKSREEIVKLEEDFKKQELILSEESKEKKRQEYLKKVEDLRGLVSKSQQEMQQIEQKIASPILNKMSVVLKKISEEKGYEIVAPKSALLYGDPKHDLTQELIKRFDKEYK